MLLIGAARDLSGHARLSDQLNARCSNHQLRREQSSGWIQSPRSSSLARSASARTVLQAGVDVLPCSLLLFLHFVLPESSWVGRCSHTSERHLIHVHPGCSHPRSLPSSVQIPASEQRPCFSWRCLSQFTAAGHTRRTVEDRYEYTPTIDGHQLTNSSWPRRQCSAQKSMLRCAGSTRHKCDKYCMNAPGAQRTMRITPEAVLLE